MTLPAMVALPSISALEHAAFVCGGLLIYVLLTRIDHQRRHPAAALAWVICIAAFPYLGLPVFLLFGSRKIARPAPLQVQPLAHLPLADAPEWALRLLAGFGEPPPAHQERIEFLADGAQALDALIDLCRNARLQLDIASYVLGNDEAGRAVAQALMAAARRGVQTRLLLDAVGSMATPGQLLRQLAGGGVQVRQFMPLLHNPMRGRSNLRNHRKVAIADAGMLWSGGRNLAHDYFLGDAQAPAWIDLSFVARGPLAAQALAQFERDWQLSSGQPVPACAAAPAADGPTTGPLAQWICSGPDRADDTLHALLMTAAYRARHRILAVTPYFVPDDALLDAWCTACRRGVSVVLVLPRRSNHRLADWARGRALRRLADAGARIALVGTMLHAKALVIDDEMGLCGSANLDSRSLFLNYEAMAAFYGAAEIAWLAEWTGTLVRDARPFDAQRPGWLRDLGEGLVRALAFQL